MAGPGRMTNAGVMGRLLAAGLLLAVEPVSAQVSQTDRTLAQSLFEEAKKLMQASRYAEACPKLEESQRLDPGGGTMLNLALCYESEGKLSTAWADFKEALSLAHRDGRPEREQAAQEHIAALEGKLPHLTITVDAPTADEELSLDGAPIGKAAWGSAMSIDPGTHEVAASAPGKNRWALSVVVAIAEHKAVAVPALGGQAAVPSAAPVGVLPQPVAPEPVEAAPGAAAGPPSTPAVGHPGRKTAGWVLVGSGVALAGVGSFFGVRAFGKRHDSNAQCPTDTTCTARGVSLNDDAKTAAWIADVGVGLGLVGIGVGTYLLLSSGGTGEKPPPATASRRLSLDASALPSGGQVTVGGMW